MKYGCVAIDPGVHACGVAVTSTDGKLVRAFYLEGFDHPAEMAHVLRRCLESSGYTIASVVIEVPQVYQTAKQKGDQGDLINLTLVAGACSLAMYDLGAKVTFKEPKDWKGQIPKSVTKLRVDAALDLDEQQCIKWPQASKKHNVYDAIHMALRCFTQRKV